MAREDTPHSIAREPAQTRRRITFLPSKQDREEAGDDYALNKLPTHWKRTPTSLFFVLSGIVWSVFSFALGGQAALTYGLSSTLVALAIATVLGFLACGVISRVTAAAGMSLDLVTRGSGYGFIGSSATSLIYGVTYLMYSGFEAALMADAVHTQWPHLNLPMLYIVASVIIVPLNWYGFTSNDFLQRITTPLFVVGLGYLMYKVFSLPTHETAVNLPGLSVSNVTGALGAALPLVAILSLNAADWSRFMKKKDINKATWLAPLVVIGGVVAIEAPLGAVMALRTGEGNPSTYAAQLLGPIGVAWIIVTQIRIQNSNFYSGTLALANFSSRILRFVPGRQFWIVFMAAVTVVATLAGILNNLLTVLTFLGIFIVGWFGTIAVDMLILRPSGRAQPHYIEHRRGYLKDWGWPALSSLLLGSAVGVTMYLADIPTAADAPFYSIVAALIIGFCGPLLIVGVFGIGGNLIARQPDPEFIDHGMTDEALDAPANMVACGVTQKVFMMQDMVACPVTPGGLINSVACAAHRTCNDVCKTSPAPLTGPGQRATTEQETTS